ncbi:MAG: hypothetical protein MK135_04830 [Polyangiaceae bacterium]|nr:hypothetical protein [Polyangiaceae bacterium]
MSRYPLACFGSLLLGAAGTISCVSTETGNPLGPMDKDPFSSTSISSVQGSTLRLEGGSSTVGETLDGQTIIGGAFLSMEWVPCAMNSWGSESSFVASFVSSSFEQEFYPPQEPICELVLRSDPSVVLEYLDRSEKFSLAEPLAWRFELSERWLPDQQPVSWVVRLSGASSELSELAQGAGGAGANYLATSTHLGTAWILEKEVQGSVSPILSEALSRQGAQELCSIACRFAGEGDCPGDVFCSACDAISNCVSEQEAFFACRASLSSEDLACYEQFGEEQIFCDDLQSSLERCEEE